MITDSRIAHLIHSTFFFRSFLLPHCLPEIFDKCKHLVSFLSFFPAISSSPLLLLLAPSSPFFISLLSSASFLIVYVCVWQCENLQLCSFFCLFSALLAPNLFSSGFSSNGEKERGEATRWEGEGKGFYFRLDLISLACHFDY